MQAIDYITPIDVLEPETTENELRDAGLAYIRIMSLAIAYILSQPDCRVATLGVAFGLGLTTPVEGKSMRQIARENGYSSGTISKHSTKFCRMSNLPPSAAMKSEATAKKLKTAREKYCER